MHTNGFLIGLIRKTSGILQQGRNRLIGFHLVGHRALHKALHIDNTFVRANDNHIIVLQMDITCLTAIEDIVIDIDRREQPAPTEDLDITQRSHTIDTTGHINGIEHRRKGRKGIRTGNGYLTHHIHLNSTGLTNRHTDRGTLITLPQLLTQLRIGLGHCQSANMNRAIAFHHNHTIGRHLQLLRLLRTTIDIEVHLIARPHHITLRRRDVHRWLEREILLVEDITTKHTFAINLIVHGIRNINLRTILGQSFRITRPRGLYLGRHQRRALCIDSDRAIALTQTGRRQVFTCSQTHA